MTQQQQTTKQDWEEVHYVGKDKNETVRELKENLPMLIAKCIEYGHWDRIQTVICRKELTDEAQDKLCDVLLSLPTTIQKIPTNTLSAEVKSTVYVRYFTDWKKANARPASN